MSHTLTKKLRNPCWQVYYYASSSFFFLFMVLCSWHPGEKHITSYLYTIDLLGLGKREEGKEGWWWLETNHLLKQKGIEMNLKHQPIFRSDKLIGQLLFFSFFFLDLNLQSSCSPNSICFVLGFTQSLREIHSIIVVVVVIMDFSVELAMWH